MRLAVIIVLYHPELAHIDVTVKAFTAANVPVILVDNSPTASPIPLPEDCHYLHFPDNVGIAKAQNEGLRFIAKHAYTHAILLDQDSRMDAKMITRLSHHFVALENADTKVAALGPTVFCEFSDTPVQPKLQRPKIVSSDLAEVKQIIASGMMLSLSALDDIGLKEEGLFIDGVDHEWCWRAQAKGYGIYQARDLLMPHRQGEARKRVLGVMFKVGAPVRLYYQARNVLFLARRSYVPLYWKLRNVTALPLRFLINRWILPEGKARGQYFVAGIRDGVAGKKGKMGERL